MKPIAVDSESFAGAGAARVDVVAVRDGVARPGTEWVADEVPVALQVNGIAHSVMMTTPDDLDDFALGFLLGEGLIDSKLDLLDVEESRASDGITLQLQVTQRCLHRFKERRRSMAGRTGCGVCGTESLSQVIRPLARAVAAVDVEVGALARAMSTLASQQTLQRATGATHAAGWCALDGTAQLVREDVGRHNALDKLIGAMAGSATRPPADPHQGFIAVTSRASFEMVHKTASAGVGLLVAISAATRLAVDLADRTGVTLIGFARGQSAVLYTHPGRVSIPSAVGEIERRQQDGG